MTLREKKWIFAVLLSIVILLLKCSIPIYEGSFFATGTDVSRHIVVAEAIKQSGNIVYPSPWYVHYPPFFHVLTSITSDVLGLPLDAVFNMFSIVIALLCVLLVFSFCKTLFNDEKLSILSAIILGVTILPPGPQPSNMVIYLIIPLVLYAGIKYLKYGSKNWFLVFCLFLTSIFLTHNASALYFLGILFLFAMLSLISKDRNYKTKSFDMFTASIFLFTASFFFLYSPLTPDIQMAIRRYFMPSVMGPMWYYVKNYYPVIFLLLISWTAFYGLFRHSFISILAKKIKIKTLFVIRIFRGVVLLDIPLLLFLLAISIIMVLVTFFLTSFFSPPLPYQIIKTGLSPLDFLFRKNTLYIALTSFQHSSFLILMIFGLIGVIKRSKKDIKLDFPLICLILPLILAVPLALFIKDPLSTRYIGYSYVPLVIFSSLGVQEVLTRIKDESKRGLFLSLLILSCILLSSFATIGGQDIDNYKESGYNWLKSDTGALLIDESGGHYIDPPGYYHEYELPPAYLFSIGEKIQVDLEMKSINKGYLAIFKVTAFGRNIYFKYSMKHSHAAIKDNLIYSNERMFVYLE